MQLLLSIFYKVSRLEKSHVLPDHIALIKQFRSFISQRQFLFIKNIQPDSDKNMPAYKDASAATSYRYGLLVWIVYMDVMMTRLPWHLGFGNPCRNDEHFYITRIQITFALLVSG